MPVLRCLLLLFLCGLVSCTLPNAPATAVETEKGRALVDSRGMTLYTFERDRIGQSFCRGTCLEKWPALLAAEGAVAQGDWTLVMRREGTRQWAYKGQPLYTWYKDVRPGDITGDNEADVWHLARP